MNKIIFEEKPKYLPPIYPICTHEDLMPGVTVGSLKEITVVPNADYISFRGTLEKTNLCAFSFEVIDAGGLLISVGTPDFKISYHESSNFYKFIVGLTGSAPKPGIDYSPLIDKKFHITIERKYSASGKSYLKITNVFRLEDRNDISYFEENPKYHEPKFEFDIGDL